MMDRFNECLQQVLKWERGYSNHPKDPGGMTNLGVTKQVWTEWTGKVPSEDEMRSLTSEAVAPLYRVRYWNRLNCASLPSGLDLCVFDFGVNSGCQQSARTLQHLVGTVPDGLIGPQTIRAVQERDTEKLIKDFCDAREEFLRKLPTFPVFGKGWLARVNGVETTALG